MFSLVSLNVVLAVFSMLMAIGALALLAFVIIREHYVPREYSKNIKVKRHESFSPDYKNPASLPPHFLHLNTLMFEKKAKVNNNQVKEVEKSHVIPMDGMDTMATNNDDQRPPPPPLHRTVNTEAIYENTVFDSEQKKKRNADSKESSDQFKYHRLDASQLSNRTDSDQSIDIEPPAEKRIIHFECNGYGTDC